LALNFRLKLNTKLRLFSGFAKTVVFLLVSFSWTSK
jgi:hypothetical protein